MEAKITALAITLNEEENVERYVKSLDFADEIIFVDSFSADRTKELAENLGVRVYQKKFNNFSEQRNFALSKASNNWILFFDLDEHISSELIKEIKSTIKNPKNHSAFYVKRLFIFAGKKIRYGGWQNDKAIRILNKKQCLYEGLVHEQVKVNGKTAILSNTLDHQSYKSFDGYNSKLTHYSNLQAEKLHYKNLRPNAYHFLFRPFYRFCWQYFWRLGFLDGKEGFILAYIHSFSVFKRYLQLWMKYRKIS